MNATENRPALHTVLRGDERVSVDGREVLAEVQRNRERMRVVAQAVREGHWKGHTGERIRDVLALGIGGSALGPRLALEALHADADGPRVRFVANVDPAELDDAITDLDPASTLVVVASKTFTTQETMANADAARRWLAASLGPEARAKHLLAATANTGEALAWGLPECNVFPFADWVGGRFSLWSSVGLPVAIGIGMPLFEQLLGRRARGRPRLPLEQRSTTSGAGAPWSVNRKRWAASLAVLPLPRSVEPAAYLLSSRWSPTAARRRRGHRSMLELPAGWAATARPRAASPMLHRARRGVMRLHRVARPMAARALHEVLSQLVAQSIVDGGSPRRTHKACPGDRPTPPTVCHARPFHLVSLLAT